MLYSLKCPLERGFIDLSGLTQGLMTPKAMKKTGVGSLEQVVLGNKRSSTLDDANTGSSPDHVLDLDSLPSFSSLLKQKRLKV